MTYGRPISSNLWKTHGFGASAAWFDRPQGETEGLGPHVDALGRDKKPGAGATIWFALEQAMR
jgi:hypothetical protein